MIRVFQFDGDEAFREEVAAYFSRLDGFSYQGWDCSADLEHVLLMDKPQIILLDFNCQPQGGMAALKRIRTSLRAEETKVIMISQTPPGERLLAQAAELGADYFLLRPVDLVVLEKRIKQLLRPLTELPLREATYKQVYDVCVAYFERMGIPPHYKGYRYLIEGIWLAAVHPEWLNSVTQNLYPAIGQRFAVSGAQVERAMRYALEAAWEKGNVDQLYQIFPYVSENKGKPTNSEFISKMAHLVALAVETQG
ncbi:sporulation initiation factor Spo0A C-terminal domain-containing protein [Candidatus Darwinibacter acetoxidans]|jgi:two-component system response regulator (stage 0 sporulation protein A)|nr:hypothetical protein [Bacillota bacterium]